MNKNILINCVLIFASIFLCSCTKSQKAAALEQPAKEYAALQTEVQKILDESIANGGQTAVQCCIYIDGKLAVDAWAGSYEKNGERKINGDSLFPIYSTEKPIFAAALHRAIELGKISYDTKIADVWPEFGCNEKQNITLRQIITHHSGLQGAPDGGTKDEQYCDWNYMVKQCANFKLRCQPGTKGQYLSRTYAWLLGEPLSRVMKMPTRDAITQLILRPAGIDKSFYFGIDADVADRCVTVYNGKGKYNIEKMNMPLHRMACVPSSNAMASARAIAKFYLRLTGMDGKTPLLKPETLNVIRTPFFGESELPKSSGMYGGDNEKAKPQLVFGHGCFLSGKAPNYGEKFGQGGLGGSIGNVDMKKKIIFAYTCAINCDSSAQSNLVGKLMRAVSK